MKLSTASWPGGCPGILYHTLYLYVCLSISTLLALHCSLSTLGALREAGRAELGSAIPTNVGPGKGTHRSWKKKT